MERSINYALTFLITAVAVVEFVQVMARYVFKVPLMGLEEGLAYLAMWLYFLGGINASREDSQIKANVLDVFLKTKRSQLKVRVIADVMSIVVSLWLTWYAWEYFLYSLRVWKLSPTLYIPMFYAECVVLIGMLIMTIYVAVYLVRNAKALLTPTQKEQGV